MYVKGIDMLIINFLYFYFNISNFWKCFFLILWSVRLFSYILYK